MTHLPPASPAPLTEISIHGVRSPVRQVGDVNADEAVVFVHGNPGSSEDWVDLLPAAGAFARAVAYDLPGFGHADKPSGFAYTAEGYTHHLADLLATLGIRRVHLVLHDWGGVIGLLWAAAHPEAFRSVVLINIGVLRGYRWHYLAKIWRTPILGELFQLTASRPGFHLLLKHGNPRGLPHAFIDRMYQDYDQGTRRAVLRLYRSANDPAGVAEQLWRALRPLDRPALVIWGRHDPYLPVSFAERQRETFPHAEVAVLDQSGHWPFADDPKRVAELLLPFLRRQVGAVAPSGSSTG
jgi:pimeloyl-ACP methyl ester carboxylesterase